MCATHGQRELAFARVGLLEECRQLQDGHLALLVADGEVLAAAERPAQAAHRDAPQHVRVDQLAQRLARLAAVAHPHVLEGALLRAERRRLRTQEGGGGQAPGGGGQGQRARGSGVGVRCQGRRSYHAHSHLTAGGLHPDGE